jgi:hypothetical protein
MVTYKYLVIKDGHVLTGFNDEFEAREYARHHSGIVYNNFE